jgi:carbohydrate kinase (thermoresistant glucokinase family)
MGVSGCGKSTVAPLLAQHLGGTFIDGDDLHPRANIAKMAAGTPLTDEDREPWLREIGARLASASDTLVIACSALKRSYRDLIRDAAPGTAFTHLHGTRELLAQRLMARPGHFMPVSLLDSQLATLEPLGSEEDGACFDIADPPEACAAAAAAWLRSRGRHGH